MCLKINDQLKKSNTYTSEFRESSIKLALESDQPIAQTARDLGVNSTTIHTWINKYSKPKTAATRIDEHIYDENKRLKILGTRACKWHSYSKKFKCCHVF